MGVPKFFRYISERYPCLSEHVKEYQIPAFDNLYLDMNGIIHMCSHPDDNNPHFRITEEKIFADIFHYIEVLFQMIKPQKVFVMAVDGVAPRAKMNQQRGRRFRSAKDAEKLEKEALKKGEKLPDGERFDSNCITPGTEFMARLHEQLKYFVVKKVSTDKLWKKCKIILSGHETPGEGEHKIMDYIRYVRSKPGYDPNTRHCLYGLDADLIMLGLCTHDPHFSLLREEVKFGKKARRTNVPEEIRFYLLHLSLMREYLELEFSSLKKQLEGSELKFDIEKIIDDWILMGFLVGNDFIPNLPNLHITNGALPVLYKAYMEVLPTLDGYINEAGTLNLPRFEKFMNKLADIDLQNFEEVYDDMLYMAAKTGRKQNFHTQVQSKPSIDDIFGTDCQEYSKDPGLEALIAATDELDVSSEEECDQMSSNEDEAFKSYKDEYYRNKLEYQKVTPEVMREQAEGYVRAIQWNLNYYYNGVCSWSWFYPHHYSPYISDIKGFCNLKIDFDLGKPFQPYEQLLAVLPTASKTLLPTCYHSLMTEEGSSIKAYYPEEFQTDLNGKRQEWEAVVLVPFIDEDVLLDAMQPCNELLTAEEAKRNQHGPMLVYEHSEEDLGTYEAPSYFLPIGNHATCKPVSYEDVRVPQDQLVKGRYPLALFDVFYPGFPTMKHLRYESKLKKAKIRVFETCSRMDSVILKISSNALQSDDVPLDMLGEIVWVGWPHLVEARVVAISNRKKRYSFTKTEKKKYRVEDTKFFDSELEGVTQHYRDRMGIDFGDTQILVHVQRMIGRKYIYTSGRRVTLEKQFSEVLSNYPLQSIVTDIAVHDDYQSTFLDVCDIFAEGDVCFSLSQPHYGAQGTIMNSEETLKNNYLTVSLSLIDEPDLSKAQSIDEKLRTSYMPLAVSARQLRISNYVFSRLTGSLFLNGEGTRMANIGLDLKFNKKNQETPGYTKKIEQTWMYSRKAVDLVGQYLKEFPEVFEFLSQHSGNEITVQDVFESEGDEKVKTIQTWIKTLPTYNLERRVCGSCVLESDVVAEVEKVADGIKEFPKNISVQIKPQMLYKPGIQVGNIPPDPLATTQIFDRVVNVREDTPVPLGLKGTVIAIHKAPNCLDNDSEMYDVVFDTRFPGGMAPNCSDQRGYRLPRTCVINVSYGRRLMEQQTGAPGALRSLAKDRSAGNKFAANLPGSPRVPNSAFASFNNVPPNFMPPPQSHAVRSFPFPTPVQCEQKARPGNSANAVPDAQKVQNSFNFMPDFGQTHDQRPNKENSVRRRNVPANVQNQRPSSSNVNVQGRQEANKRPSNSSQRPVQPQQRTEVNTDFLKRILNINSNSNSTRSGVPPQGEPPRPPRTFNRAQEVSNSASAAARLLSYYQSSSWGCPRYTYLEEDGGFCAQLVLPDGKIMNGRVARNREEASDTVASEALKMFQFISKSSKEGLPSQFPVPPTKWVQDWRAPNQMVSQVFVNKSHQRSHPRPDSLIRSDFEPNTSRGAENPKLSTSVHAPNFVPLQALKKKQGTRFVNSVNRNQNNGLQFTKPEKISILKPTTQNAADASKAHGSSNNEKRERNRGDRKPRIAANFNV